MAPKQEVSVSPAASSWPEYAAVKSFSSSVFLFFFGMVFQIKPLTGPDVWDGGEGPVSFLRHTLPPVVTHGVTEKLLCSLVTSIISHKSFPPPSSFTQLC